MPRTCTSSLLTLLMPWHLAFFVFLMWLLRSCKATCQCPLVCVSGVTSRNPAEAEPGTQSRALGGPQPPAPPTPPHTPGPGCQRGPGRQVCKAATAALLREGPRPAASRRAHLSSTWLLPSCVRFRRRRTWDRRWPALATPASAGQSRFSLLGTAPQSSGLLDRRQPNV